ncbi:hypothetical protein ACTL6P_00800 [Endozoicomonas acroporae]|nr:hypothetical protein [Endozoicomonas acroporae]
MSFGAIDEKEGKTLSGDQVLNNLRAKFPDNKWRGSEPMASYSHLKYYQ